MPKIVFISPKAYPGVSSVGLGGAGTGLWNFEYFEDLKSLEIDADIVILGAYHPQYNKLKIDGKLGYWWTSSCFEMEQTGNTEINYLANILNALQDQDIDFILFGDHGLGRVFESIVGVYSVPYPIDISLRSTSKWNEGVGFFVPPKLSKNIFTNLLAFRKFQENRRDIKLHTNLMHYGKLINFFGIEHYLYDWFSRKKYHNLLGKMKANLHCTIAETNAYQVWSASLLNVPSVVSRAVKWYPVKELIVDNTNDIIEISSKIGECIDNDWNIRKRVLPIAKENNKNLENILSKLI